MKQAELARLTGLAKGTITALYHDRVHKVDYDVLGRLCRVLGCQPGDLLVYVPGEDAPELRRRGRKATGRGEAFTAVE
jgi:putative transcriptional regulator